MNAAKVMCAGLLAAGLCAHQAFAASDAAPASKTDRASSARPAAASPSDTKPEPMAADRPKRVNFERESASQDARHMADWIVDSGDNRSLPFAIIDKIDAKVFVFDAHGRLRGAAAVLLGMATGDESVPGIGKRKLAGILPEERTTPAGRFLASIGRNISGKKILWVDYEASISLHPVITSDVKERRAQRLATPSPLDNRISYGCINVPVKFFNSVVSPAFTGTNGIVYVLPETRTPQKVFASYDVD